MNRILVIGSASFVGKSLVECLKKDNEVIGTYNNKKNMSLDAQERLDITKKEEVLKCIKKIKPDVIIILAALSKTNALKGKIRKVNAIGVLNVKSAAEKLGLNPKIVLFSTDQIFDGKKGPYLETDVPNPINEYGKSKLEAEAIIKKYPNHLILRFSLILGNKGHNEHDDFISTFIKTKDRLKVFKDVCRTPIYVKDIGKVISELIKIDYKGVLNVSGDDFISYLKMAKSIEKAFNLKKGYDVVECSDNCIPKRLGLKNNLLKSLIEFNATGFQEMLQKMERMKHG